MIMAIGYLALGIQIATGRIIGEVVAEPHEAKLKQLLRQSGMNIKTEVSYRLVIYSILCAVLLPIISIFIRILVLTNVSWGVIMIFLVLFVADYFLLSTILTYGFGRFSILANVLYTILVVIVGFLTALNPSISQTQITLTSLIPNL